MKKYLLLTLTCITGAALPSFAINIPVATPSTSTQVLESQPGAGTSASFDVIADISTSGESAIQSTLVAGDWTINNPNSRTIEATGAGPFFGVNFPSPGITEYLLTNGGTIAGSGGGVNTFTTGDTVILNQGSGLITGLPISPGIATISNANTQVTNSDSAITGTIGLLVSQTDQATIIFNVSSSSITGSTSSAIDVDSSGSLSIQNQSGSSISGSSDPAIKVNTIAGSSLINNTDSTILSTNGAGIDITTVTTNTIQNTFSSGTASNIFGTNAEGIKIASILGDSSITQTTSSAVSPQIKGTEGISISTCGSSITNSCNISNTGGTIAGTINSGIFINEAKGNITITNQNTSLIPANIAGNTQGISIGSSGSSASNSLNISNTNASIIGTNNQGILLNNTFTGNIAITNTASSSDTSFIGGDQEGIYLPGTTTGNVSITNTGDFSSDALIQGIISHGINLNSVGGSFSLENNNATVSGSNGVNVSSASAGFNITNSGTSSKIRATNGKAITYSPTDVSQSITISNTSAALIDATSTAIEINNTNSLAGPVSCLISNNGSGSRITSNGSTSASDAINLIATEGPLTANINNTNGALITATDDAISLSSAFNNSDPFTISLINSGTNSRIESSGTAADPSRSAVQTNFLGSNSHLTLTNSDSALIKGKTEGIGIFGNLFSSTTNTHVINNTSIIDGGDGPAINVNPNNKSKLTINLDTNSQLLFGGTTAILCSQNPDTGTPTNKPNTINLAGTATQTGDFKNVHLLNKSGSETWTLTTSAQHEIDTINVNAGTLNLTGTVVANPFTSTPHTTTVKSGATLKGNCAFGSALPDSLIIESGAFHKPGNSIGATVVNGLYSLNGTIETEYNPTVVTVGIPGGPFFQSDFVSATTANVSSATIDAKKSIPASLTVNNPIRVLTTTNGYKVNGVNRPIAAAGETCDPEILAPGTSCFGFTSILNNFVDQFKLLLQATPNGTGGALITLKPVNPSLLNLLLMAPGTPSQEAINLATQIDAISAAPGTPIYLLKAYGLNAGTAGIKDFLALLTPRTLADPPFISKEIAQTFLERLRNHTSNLRDHNPPARNNSLWIQPFVEVHDRDNTTLFAGLDARTFGFASGYDYFLNPHFQLGATLGYTNTNLDWKRNLGNSEINSLFWGPYASYKCLDKKHQGYYLDFALLAGWHDYKNKRYLPPTTFVAKSDPCGWSFDARLGAGYNILVSEMLVTPFGYFDYLWTRQKAFTETGAGNANLTFSTQTADLIRYELGTSMSQNFNVTPGLVLAPKLTLSWVNKTPIGRQNLNTAFIGQNNFSIQSYDKTRNQFAAHIEATAIIEEHLFVGLFYKGEIGENQMSHTTGIKGSFRF